MGVKKVLIATDFSEQADVAVDKGTQIAEAQRAHIVLLYVNPPAEPPPSGVAFSARAMAQVNAVVEEIREEAKERVEALAEKLRGRGIEVATKLAAGHPDSAIVAAAEEVGAELLVIGTHGRSGVSRFLLGSVAERVARSSPVPVLIVRRPQQEETGFKNVLVPTDFSPASERSMELAVALVTPPAAIHLFHAWQFPAAAHSYFSKPASSLEHVREEITAAISSRADEWRERFGRDGVTIDFAHASGPPAALIQERLEADGASYDLVALGGHGHRGFRRLLLGSVAESTVRHSRCSVLVAHAVASDEDRSG